MDREPTFRERGVFVRIDAIEWERIKDRRPIGFLLREAYPPVYEDIAEDNEIGRLDIFRFIEEG